MFNIPQQDVARLLLVFPPHLLSPCYFACHLVVLAIICAVRCWLEGDRILEDHEAILERSNTGVSDTLNISIYNTVIFITIIIIILPFKRRAPTRTIVNIAWITQYRFYYRTTDRWR
jgi:hypothetical protein